VRAATAATAATAAVKRAFSNGNVSEELQELSIAENGRNTAKYQLGCGHAQLSVFFYWAATSPSEMERVLLTTTPSKPPVCGRGPLKLNAAGAKGSERR
jgi:hypothetical protein